MKKDNFAGTFINTFNNNFPVINEEIVTLHHDFDEGYIDNTFYPFLPGIYVCLNDVHSKNIPMNANLSDKDLFLINYCISGRCEFMISDNVFKYVKDNYTSIGSYTVRDEFFYPAGYYLGFEIFIYRDMFTDETRKILESFNIDLDILTTKYNNNEKLTLLETDINSQKLWLELYNNKTPDKGLIRLNILRILHNLISIETAAPANSSYLTRNQAKLAKNVQKIITKDISKHISMREISSMYNISETSLKNYFSAMFGMSVSEYMLELRLKKASELLAKSRLPISEIANSCGYSNQGRFAKIFKSRYGMLPLEYRHNSSDIRHHM